MENKRITCSWCWNDDIKIKKAFVCSERTKTKKGHYICYKCIKHTIKFQIRKKKPSVDDGDDEISSIMSWPQCCKTEQHISYKLLYKICKKKKLKKFIEKYDEFKLKELKLKYCPSNKCSMPYLFDDNSKCKKKKVKCLNKKCKLKWCLECGKKWRIKHKKKCKGKIIINNDVLKWIKKNEKIERKIKNRKYTKKSSIMCPRCNILIIKNGGCKMMNCRWCHYKFCFFCKHTNGCRCDSYHDSESSEEETDTSYSY